MNGIQSYYNPLDSASIRKSLVDERLQQVNVQLARLKTAPADVSDETIDFLLQEMAAAFKNQMEQILESR